MPCDVKHLFLCLWATHVPTMQKHLFKSFSPLLFLFIYLVPWALVEARGTFDPHCGMHTLFLKIYVYVFGCIGYWLRHAKSSFWDLSLCLMDSLAVARGILVPQPRKEGHCRADP